jgi:predicted O-linked N-acetylglucosamine transferase (SPINDLY family)
MQENMLFKEAIVNYKTVLSIDSNYKEAHLNLGLIFSEIGNFKQALINYESAIKIDPLYIDALFNKGNLLMENKYLRQSLECYEEVHLLNSEYDYLKGILFYNRMQLSEWTNFDTCLFELIDSIKKNKKTSPCLPIQLLCDSAHIQLMNTLIWVNDKYPTINDNRPISKSRFDEKIRIGYYSSDFREHPVSYLLAELIELHDREKFEIIGFNIGNITHDNLYMRISKAFDKFYEVKFKSDNDIAILSRELNIDIAVDLNGFTSQARTGIFSIRVAPIQMSYIGYLGTMGADYYDYLISDKIIIPQNYQKFYTEKIIYLPSFQVNDSKREISNKIFTKTELGIPDNYFIYCCFNNNIKITPIIYDSWMRILHAVPESVLILFCENSCAIRNLQKEAENRGISPNRLIFVGRIGRSEYLARCKIADLFLDTFPYNAGTTASDALWVGLPVLTLMGESFASRVAASLLNSIGLSQLISNSLFEYEEMAIELAIKNHLLIEIKNKLTINRESTRLFDTKLFAKEIENAYTEVYAKLVNNLPLQHVYIG